MKSSTVQVQGSREGTGSTVREGLCRVLCVYMGCVSARSET